MRREGSTYQYDRPTSAKHPAASGARVQRSGGSAGAQLHPARDAGDFEAMSAEELLRWAYDEYGDELVLTCSWQRQSSALVHMVSELGLPIDVVELDTQLFFRES